MTDRLPKQHINVKDANGKQLAEYLPENCQGWLDGFLDLIKKHGSLTLTIKESK